MCKNIVKAFCQKLYGVFISSFEPEETAGISKWFHLCANVSSSIGVQYDEPRYGATLKSNQDRRQSRLCFFGPLSLCTGLKIFSGPSIRKPASPPGRKHVSESAAPSLLCTCFLVHLFLLSLFLPVIIVFRIIAVQHRDEDHDIANQGIDHKTSRHCQQSVG